MSTPLNKTILQAEAELLVDFVNSFDLEEGTDSIATPEALAAWVEARTGDYIAVPDAEAHARTLTLRESLRVLLRANNGLEGASDALAPLRQAAERSRYRTALSAEGELTLVPARSDLGGFEARVLLALERLQSHGAWPRLKACPEDSCQWAFFDATRNRSRTWCSMEECGNRTKTRRYRERSGSRSGGADAG